MNGSEAVAGTWMSPEGVRVEVAQHGDRWESRTYLSSMLPPTVHHFETVDQIREAIHRLETQNGFVRQQSGMPRPPATATMRTGRALLIIGAVVAFVLLLGLLLS